MAIRPLKIGEDDNVKGHIYFTFHTSPFAPLHVQLTAEALATQNQGQF